MYYDLQQVLYNNSATFTHSHYVHIGMFYLFLSPYLMHKRGNPQETFGGGQAPKFTFDSCPWV